jgi:hypothetical protein
MQTDNRDFIFVVDYVCAFLQPGKHAWGDIRHAYYARHWNGFMPIFICRKVER